MSTSTSSPDQSSARSEVRVLVTGSRAWDQPQAITGALDDLVTGLSPGQTLTVVHGANRRGADAIADAWATARHRDGYDVRAERHPSELAPERQGRRDAPQRVHGRDRS